MNTDERSFNDLVMEWNKKVNLVSRKKEDVYDLIEDSKVFLHYLPDTEMDVMDLGTGGGFPGIVIKIHRPGYRVVLVDSIQKKINAVKDIIDKLELKDAIVIWSRVEELAKEKKYERRFDVIVSRSVAPLPELLQWSKELIKTDGILLTLKGRNIEDEIEAARKLKHVNSIECYEHDVRMMVKCVMK